MTHLGDEDINEPPDFPTEWTSEQRVAAYWHAVNFTGFPGTTEGWWSVWKNLEREQQRRIERRSSESD